jgi:hypothetical protein
MATVRHHLEMGEEIIQCAVSYKVITVDVLVLWCSVFTQTSFMASSHLISLLLTSTCGAI